MNSSDIKIADTQLSDGEMLKNIMEDLRHLRKLFEANESDHQSIRKDIAKIREENAGERVKLGGIVAVISMVVGALIAWIVSHLTKS